MTACFARQPFPEGRTAREAIKNGHRLTDGRVERNTKQKELIHDALKANDEFISAQDLHRKLEDEGVKVGLATVYRQLNALAEAGEADTVRLEGQQLFCVVMTGITIISYARIAAKPWKSNRHPKLGCVASARNTDSPSNGIRLRCSDYAPTAGMRHDGNSVDLNNFADFSNNGYVDGGILDDN